MDHLTLPRVPEGAAYWYRMIRAGVSLSKPGTRPERSHGPSTQARGTISSASAVPSAWEFNTKMLAGDGVNAVPHEVGGIIAKL